MSAGSISDRSTKRKRLLRRIPYTAFSFEPSHTHNVTQAAGTVSVTITTASGEGLVGMDDGAPLITEISSFGVGGVEIAAAGDSLSCWDFETLCLADVTETIGVRVIWVEDVATPGATDVAGWVALYDQFDPGEAMVAPATALDTVIAAHTPAETTGRKMRRTARGIINKNSFDAAAKSGGLAWNVECDVLTNYSINEVKFLALEIDFLPNLYQFSGEGINVHTKASAA